MNTRIDELVLRDLTSGKTLTTKEIRTKYRVLNPRDPVYRLRQKGYVINLVESNKIRRYVLNSTDKAAVKFTIAAK